MTLFDMVSLDREKVYEDFMYRMIGDVGEGWTELFKGCTEDSDILYDIAKQLYTLGKGGQRICPGSLDVFRCFRESKFSITNVVFVGQDPYYQPGVADGLAFSCSRTGKEQPSLKFVLDEIQKSVYGGGPYTRKVDLTGWANQGVLLLNTALTVEQYKPDSHTALWKPFIQYLLRELNNKTKGTLFVFLGNRAKAFAELIDSKKHTKFLVTHPAAAAHTGAGVWDSKGIFSEINSILREKKKKPIFW